MEDFDAEEFIDGWSESYMWREELAAGNITPHALLGQLMNLEEDYERQGLREEGSMDVDWWEVEETLKSYVKEKE